MLSRRSFTTLLGGAAASAAIPFPILAATPQSTSIRLSANENPYGPPQSAIAAMREAFSLAARYPDDEADALVKDVAASHDVPIGRVLLGSDETGRRVANLDKPPAKDHRGPRAGKGFSGTLDAGSR